MGKAMRAALVAVAILAVTVTGVAAKEWTKKGEDYTVEVWGSAYTVEKGAMILGSSICVALEMTHLSEAGRKPLLREQYINGILNTTSGLSITFNFHPEPAGGRAQCAPLADEKKVKKLKKQLSKGK